MQPTSALFIAGGRVSRAGGALELVCVVIGTW